MELTATAMYRVPFHDIDVMNIVWHGNYFRYFELARTALVQSIGFDWPDVREWGFVMPVVDVAAHFKRSVIYNQELRLVATCSDPMLPAFDLKYEVRSADNKTLHVTGTSRQVYFDVAENSISYALPAVFERKFREIAIEGGLKP